MILKVSIELEDDTTYHFTGAPREAIDAIKQLMGEKAKPQAKKTTQDVLSSEWILDYIRRNAELTQRANQLGALDYETWVTSNSTITTSGSSF